jgi:serine/threonine-protein kinase HipA
VTKELVVLLSDRAIGRVNQDERGKLSFTYDPAWRDTPGAYPLSMSMPLAALEHPHDKIEAFIWGLLPDNEFVLDRWAKKFQVSSRSPFALIANVGEDCAGAVQFVRPDRLEAVLGTPDAEIAWLTEADIAERLRQLRNDNSAWRRPGDSGQFSLAGAQPKTALLLQDGKWGVPSGRIPTTHILKPPSAQFDGHAENEHFCLALARAVGLPAATSTVTQFEDEIAFVVERYDRLTTPAGISRIHQEDMCQAVGVPPMRKYENEGGPGVLRIVDLLRETSSAPEDDSRTFLDAIALNWLIGGTDAHAKNYSLLIAGGSRVRLAPLYDVASILPYDFDAQRIRLAMKIGDKYRIRDVTARSWEKLSEALGLDAGEVESQVSDLARRIAQTVATIGDNMRGAGMDHQIVERLVERIGVHASKSAALFTPA